ncbi:MAG: nucleotide exchange factor GrpE [Lachnospiraceae bacterium]|nr:nucleotide exchange factor GrpE [Lachnospiraceae bacterium]
MADKEKQNEQTAEDELAQNSEAEQDVNTAEAAEAMDAAEEADAEDMETDAESCEETEEAGAEKGKASWVERRAAKKQEKKDKKEEQFKEQISQLEDKVKRQLAEFENFRNRTEKEKSAMFETGAKSVIEKMLPVIDNFERGLATVPEEQKDDPFVDGMNRIYKQLVTELENIGVKPIEAVGCEFDPNLHNAVMLVEIEEYESGVVAQELQKGYTYRDTVVRHSMVAVVQ